MGNANENDFFVMHIRRPKGRPAKVIMEQPLNAEHSDGDRLLLRRTYVCRTSRFTVVIESQCLRYSTERVTNERARGSTECCSAFLNHRMTHSARHASLVQAEIDGRNLTILFNKVSSSTERLVRQQVTAATLKNRSCIHEAK